MDTHDYQVVVFRKEDRPELAEETFRFRKRLFIDICGWELPAEGDCETDQFDTEAAVYCALRHGGELAAMFRAVRTDHPYLAAELFGELASFHPYPRDARYWEISRFGVMPGPGALRTAQLNYAMMFQFARRVGATGLVALADLTYERFLTMHGIRTRRYGPPRECGNDREGRPLELVAGEIPIRAQGGEKYARLIALAQSLEVEDAAQILGPSRISA